MYRILIPVDRNETRANRQADFVTDLPLVPGEVEVVVLYVHDKVSGGDSGTERIDHSQEMPATVTRVQSQLEQADFTVSRREEIGDAADRIVEIADETTVDLIVLAGRKRSPVGKALFGSTTQQTILNSSRPVTVIG